METDRASTTAYLIARSTVFVSRDPRIGHLVPARSAEICDWFIQERSQRARWLLNAMCAKWFRPAVSALERMILPGIQLHYVLRKLYLEEITRRALRAGFRQIVALGAGFDTLALRLCEEFPQAHFIEIDHPTTQQIKRGCIEKHYPPKQNLLFLPLDFNRQSLAGKLTQCDRCESSENTLLIAEGLLMYLALSEVDEIFSFIRHHSGPRSLFAFTFMEQQEDGRIAFSNSSRMIDAWLRFRGETFKWGIRRDRLSDYLAARGFALRDIAAPDTLRRRYLVSERMTHLPLAHGECISLASRA